MGRILLFFFFLGLFSVQGQQFKYGKVSEEELIANAYGQDPEARGVILHKGRETFFEYSESKEWTIVTRIQERVKILNKDGLDLAVKKIRAYKNSDNKESIVNLEAYTYNLEDGKIKKTKLEKKAIFETLIDEYWDQTAFTLPDVKVGSVLEWSYELRSPFWKIDDLIFQDEVPVAHYYAKISIPAFFTFRRVQKGSFELEPKESIKKRNLLVSWLNTDGYGSGINKAAGSMGKIIFNELIQEYEKEHLPALKEEPFVYNPENYRFAVVYELKTTEFTEGIKKEYTTTWEEVARSVLKEERFGKQLQNIDFLKNAVSSVEKKYLDPEERMNFIFDLIKKKMTWNGNYGKYTKQDLEKAFDENSGNVAEINLILTALLRECGLDANPVLVSTKNYGIPLFPTLEGFNYVITGVRLNNELILLDATDKLAAPGLMPIRAYNWTGRMVENDGSITAVDLFGSAQGQENLIISAEFDTRGMLKGTVKRRYSELSALNFRDANRGITTARRELLLADDLGFGELRNLQQENLENMDKPVDESFDFETSGAADVIGDNIYFSPLLFCRLAENPFKSDERQYPIDFAHAFVSNKIITIKIPEGYEVVSLPESLNISLPDGIGSFKFVVSENGDTISTSSRYILNKPFIDVEQYPALKKFFDLRFTRENEKVILVKI